MNKMGYKIKDLREARAMTQEELAEKSGVSRGTISALENEESKNATTSTLMKLAIALGVTLDELFFAPSV